MTKEITAIWQEFHQELKGFILQKTRNAADADDILQDAFIRIIRNWDKVNQAENLRGYIYAIVRNALYDHLKNKKPLLDSPEIQDIFTDEEDRNLNASVAECCIRPFINKLPDHYRDVLLITEFENVSQKDLASRLGISYSGAKSRVQRGKEKLKEMILGCCAYDSDAYGNLIGREEKNCGNTC